MQVITVHTIRHFYLLILSTFKEFLWSQNKLKILFILKQLHHHQQTIVQISQYLVQRQQPASSARPPLQMHQFNSEPVILHRQTQKSHSARPIYSNHLTTQTRQPNQTHQRQQHWVQWNPYSGLNQACHSPTWPRPRHQWDSAVVS